MLAAVAAVAAVAEGCRGDLGPGAQTETGGTTSDGTGSTGGTTLTTGSDATGSESSSTTSDDSSAGTSGSGTSTATSGSTTTTGPPAQCGNGMTETSEECDDGNLVAGDGCSAVCLDETLACEPRVVGSFPTTINLVTAADGYAYFTDADGNANLFLVDMSDPTLPTYVNQIATAGDNFVMRYQNGHVFMGGFMPSVTAVDVSDPATPSISDTLPLAGDPAETFEINATVAYIARDNGISIVNIVNPAALQDLGGFTTPGEFMPYYTGVAVHQTRAYAHAVMIGVFDVANPTLPTHVSTLMDPGMPGVLRASGDGSHLYGTTCDGELLVYDVTDDANPARLVNATGGPSVCSQMLEARGDFVYAADQDEGVTVWDVTDASTPKVATTFFLGGSTDSLVLSPTHVYATDAVGMQVLADLPGYCTARCGNSVIEYPEICDDGNLTNGDGCAADCG